MYEYPYTHAHTHKRHHVEYESSITMVESIAAITIHEVTVHLVLISIIYILTLVAVKISE